MTDVITHMALGIISAIAAVLFLLVRSAYCLIAKADRAIASQDKVIENYAAYKVAVRASIVADAHTEECSGDREPYFSVYRISAGTKIEIKRVYYDPSDLDDRDYKRIHAEEVAEKLNERP